MSKNIPFKISSPTNWDECDLTSHLEGSTRLDSLVLVDREDGKEWVLSVRGGVLNIEPFCKIERRDFKIDKIIDGN